MTKEELVQSVKRIMALVRAEKHDEAFAGYLELFSKPDFLQLRPDDQRQALRLMVHAKLQGREPSKAMIDAHRSAVLPLTELVLIYDEPGDYEMLGMCHLLLGTWRARRECTGRGWPSNGRAIRSPICAVR